MDNEPTSYDYKIDPPDDEEPTCGIVRYADVGGCACHISAPCIWCEGSSECYECGEFIRPDEDVWTIAGSDEDFCESCHEKLCERCGIGGQRR